MEPQPITLTFEFTKREAVVAGLLLQGKARKANFTLFGWVAVILLAGMLFLVIQKNNTPSPPSAGSTGQPAMPMSPTPPGTSAGGGSTSGGSTGESALTALVPWVLVFFFIWFFLFRQMRGGAVLSPIIGQRRTYTFRPDGITLVVPYSREELEWPIFQDFLEKVELEFFLLKTSPITGHAIPKRAFVDESEMNRFRAMVKQHIDSPSAQNAFPVTLAATPALPALPTSPPPEAATHEPMVITCKYSVEEMRRALPHISQSTRLRTRFRGYVNLVILGIVIVVAWAIILPDELRRMFTGGPDFVFSFPFVFVITWVAIFALGPLGRRFYFLRYAQRTDTTARPHTFVLRDDLVIVTLPQSRHEYAWPSFVKFDETGEFIFLWPSRVSAYIFPKRVFKDAEEMERFRAMLRDHVNKQ